MSLSPAEAGRSETESSLQRATVAAHPRSGGGQIIDEGRAIGMSESPRHGPMVPGASGPCRGEGATLDVMTAIAEAASAGIRSTDDTGRYRRHAFLVGPTDRNRPGASAHPAGASAARVPPCKPRTLEQAVQIAPILAEIRASRLPDRGGAGPSGTTAPSRDPVARRGDAASGMIPDITHDRPGRSLSDQRP